MAPLELWGGPECTVNRIGERFSDQLCATGHDRRDLDIDLIASLSLAAIRYPLLWERIARSRDRWQGGIWHLSNGETLSWFEFAHRLARACALDAGRVVPLRSDTAASGTAARPYRTGLASTRGCLLPPLDDAIRRFAQEIAERPATAAGAAANA